MSDSPNIRHDLAEAGRFHLNGAPMGPPRTLTAEEKAWLARQPDHPAAIGPGCKPLTAEDRLRLDYELELQMRREMNEREDDDVR